MLTNLFPSLSPSPQFLSFSPSLHPPPLPLLSFTMLPLVLLSLQTYQIVVSVLGGTSYLRRFEGVLDTGAGKPLPSTRTIIIYCTSTSSVVQVSSLCCNSVYLATETKSAHPCGKYENTPGP